MKKLASDWKTYVALIAAAGAALSGLTELVTSAAGTVSAFKGLSAETRWVVVGIFSIITIVFFVAALSRKSQLIEPKRFLLSSDNPEHLVGREEEVAHLARQCERHSLVFLVGDSGSGKTSLVRAGLAHSLLSNVPTLGQPDAVPLVLDLSGVAWQKGLSRALARTLGRLPEEAWKKLDEGNRPAAQDVFGWLGKRPPHAPRRLLIVLDQFDDYLAVHREQFYDGTTLRRPKEIEQRNKDWHGLATVLRSGSVCVLVVARSEAAGSLPALCFVEDNAIAREHLTRLPGSLVEPLLVHLTESSEEHPVVTDPGFGWLQLRSRLLRDLQTSGDGHILPIQLAVALNSLRLSRYLTPGEYERQGGLRGLERLHVERHAEKAASTSGVSKEAILEALLTMANSDGSKTRPLLRAAFDAVLGRHGATPQASGDAISSLEDDCLLRRITADTGAGETLLLYHDYLARGVREAYRQANQWTALLRERAQLFQEALGWRQRWRALLAPKAQVRLLWERVRGRFSFDGKFRFFCLSTVRWLPIALAVLLMGAGGWGIDRYRKHQIAAEVMQAIGHEASMSEEEAHQLLRLHSAGYDAGIHALHLAIADVASAKRASTRADVLVNLIIGLDSDSRRSEAIAGDFVAPLLENTQTNSEIASFAAAIASHLHFTPPAARRIAQLITSRMRTESDSLALASLGSSLGLLGADLNRRDVVPGANALVARMLTEPETGELTSLSSAFASLSSKLDRQDLSLGISALTARMNSATNSSTVASLGFVLGSLVERLERNNLTPGAQALAKWIRIEPATSMLLPRGLGEALGLLSTKLQKQDLSPLALAVVERMRTESDSNALARLGETLGYFSSNLDKEDIAPGAAILIERMTTESGSIPFAELSAALGSLSEKLAQQDAAKGTSLVMKRSETETNPFALFRLWSALSRLSESLERKDIVLFADSVVARMQVEPNSRSLASLGFVLGRLRAKLDWQILAPGAAALIARMRIESDGYALANLGSALDSLTTRLERDEIGAGISIFTKHIVLVASDRNALGPLGSALGSLCAKVDGPDVNAAFDVLVLRIGSDSFRGAVAIHTEGLVSLGSTLTNPIRLTSYSQPVRVEQVYVDLLKMPFTASYNRLELLKGLERATGQKFFENTWNFVDWATQTDTGRSLKLDLEGPPPWAVALN